MYLSTSNIEISVLNTHTHTRQLLKTHRYYQLQKTFIFSFFCFIRSKTHRNYQIILFIRDDFWYIYSTCSYTPINTCCSIKYIETHRWNNVLRWEWEVGEAPRRATLTRSQHRAVLYQSNTDNSLSLCSQIGNINSDSCTISNNDAPRGPSTCLRWRLVTAGAASRREYCRGENAARKMITMNNESRDKPKGI